MAGPEEGIGGCPGTARERHLKLREDSEVKKHSGIVINLDLTVQ